VNLWLYYISYQISVLNQDVFYSYCKKKSPLPKGFQDFMKPGAFRLKDKHCVSVCEEAIFLVYGFLIGFHQQVITGKSGYHHHHG